MRFIKAGWRTGISMLAMLAGCASPPREASPPTSNEPVPPGGTTLPPPRPARDWDEVRLQAAQRLVAANPDGSYTGLVIEPLLAVPVLEIELNGDGSIRRIDVMRRPSQAEDTTDLAKAALRRAAPFGDVSHLPRPWRFVETFLFNDERKFKPRTLDH